MCISVSDSTTMHVTGVFLIPHHYEFIFLLARSSAISLPRRMMSTAFTRIWYKYGMHIVNVCQMLSCWTKNPLYSINIQDTVTNGVPLCSVYQTPSYEPNLTLLASFLSEFAYLSMLFILEVVLEM